MPKFNLYQSLHTTVVGPQGKRGRGADPHAGDAPSRRVRHRRALGLQGAGSPAEDLRLARSAWSTGSRRPTDPGEFMESLKIDLEQDEVFVFTPKGKVITLADGRDAGRLRVRDPHRGRSPLHRRQGERPSRPARLDARVGRHASRSSRARSKARARAATGCSSCTRRGRAAKIRQWFSRERRVDAIDTGRDELVKALRKEGLPVQKLARSSALCARGRGDALRRPRRALRRRSARGTCRPRTVVQRVQRELRGGEEQLPVTIAPAAARPARGDAPSGSTSRASTTSWCGSRGAARRCPATRSWGS